jgi:hypothetical protein
LGEATGSFEIRKKGNVKRPKVITSLFFTSTIRHLGAKS